MEENADTRHNASMAFVSGELSRPGSRDYHRGEPSIPGGPLNQTEPDVQPMGTPNPRSVKFLTDHTLLKSGSADFRDPESARDSLLARRLFDLDGVEGVFICANFLTVTASSDDRWNSLAPQIVRTVKELILSGEPLVAEPEKVSSADGSDVANRIREILDQQIRPAVAMDGGDIVFVGFDQGVVRIQMQGACGGCPSSTMTLKSGIEARLRHLVPEVETVEAV